MFAQSHKAFYAAFTAKRWKGFRLWATDGTGFRLPNETWLGDTFGWHENQHNKVPSARLLMCYDLYNAIITRVKFHTRKVAESVVALKALGEIPIDVLMVYNRGFAGHIIPFLHQHFGSNCLIRIPVGFNNTAKSYNLSNPSSQVKTRSDDDDSCAAPSDMYMKKHTAALCKPLAPDTLFCLIPAFFSTGNARNSLFSLPKISPLFLFFFLLLAIALYSFLATIGLNLMGLIHC